MRTSFWSSLAIGLLALGPALPAATIVDIGQSDGGPGTGLSTDAAWHFQLGIPRDDPGSSFHDLAGAGEAAPDLDIVQIAFRVRTATSNVPAGSAFSDFTVKMSNSAVDSSTRTLVYADNHGGDVATVRSGPLTLGALTGDQNPNPYDIVIPLDTAFTRDLTKNLIIEIIATPSNGPFNWELSINEPSGGAEVEPPSSYRIYRGTATTADGGDGRYHAVQLTYVPEPISLGLLPLTGVLLARRRSA